MNLHCERQHMIQRREQIRSLFEKLPVIKECDQCRAIVHRDTGVCPFCTAYRFKEDEETVWATLQIMGEVPWPRNAGYVPRLASETNKHGVSAWQKPSESRQEFYLVCKPRKRRKTKKRKA